MIDTGRKPGKPEAGRVDRRDAIDLEQRAIDATVKKNRLQAEMDYLGRENLELKKELRALREKFKDAWALLDDKKKLDVYAENKELKYEIALRKMEAERNLLGIRREEEDLWIISYADMVTLLLVFFVFVYSFSIVNEQEFQKAASSLVRTFKTPAAKSQEEPRTPPPEVPDAQGGDRDYMDRMKADIEELIKDKQLQENVDITWKGGELVIGIKARIFFESGSAALAKEARPLLTDISMALEGAHKIVVEGHTDDIPIHTAEFPSNWELSAVRASTVVRFFIETGRIAPEKLTAVGFAHYVPLVPNASEENRASNRRVEIKVRHPKEK